MTGTPQNIHELFISKKVLPGMTPETSEVSTGRTSPPPPIRTKRQVDLAIRTGGRAMPLVRDIKQLWGQCSVNLGTASIEATWGDREAKKKPTYARLVKRHDTVQPSITPISAHLHLQNLAWGSGAWIYPLLELLLTHSCSNCFNLSC